MPTTRFVAVEAKATKRPLNTLPLVQAVVPVVTVSLPHDETDDCMLAPSAGVVPSGVEINVVTGVQVLAVLLIVVTHVLLSKISELPLEFGAVEPKFVAVDVNETNNPSSEMDGLELGPLPNVAPSGVETRYVVGTHAPDVMVVWFVVILHVLRMYTCGVVPFAVMLVTRFVASETNATYWPSGLTTGL